MNVGYLRLYRQTLESDVWDLSLVARTVFFWLLMSVNYKEKTTGRGVLVGVGEIVTSYRQIAEAISPKGPRQESVTAKQARSAVDDLISIQVLTKLPTGQGMGQGIGQTYLHLKLLQWSKYQAVEGQGIGQAKGQGQGRLKGRLKGRLEAAESPANEPTPTDEGAGLRAGDRATTKEGKKETLINISEGRGFVAQWVDAEREAGRDPGPSLASVFGAKLKAIPEVDPLIMVDAIQRMVDTGKHPGYLPYAYADVQRAAEKELFVIQTGGRPRAR